MTGFHLQAAIYKPSPDHRADISLHTADMRLTALTLSALLGALLVQVVAAEPTKSKPPKPGNCPWSIIPYGPCPVIPEEELICKSDQDCEGKRKCCQDGCGVMCKDPEEPTKPPKPGTCPLSPIRPMPCPRIPGEQPVCNSDQDCDGKQKCCRDFCNVKCRDPIEPTKPGNCPPVPLDFIRCPMVIPENQCSSDQECEGAKKCCPGRCQRMCKPPIEPTKPGKCPPPMPTFIACKDPLPKSAIFCSSDKQCGGAKKCCMGACQKICRDPAEPTKPGKCPPPMPTLIKCPDQLPESAILCPNDEACGGAQKCCMGACQKICRDPAV